MWRAQWQLFQDGPHLLPPQNGKPISEAVCANTLRTNWCSTNGTAAQSAVFYGVHPTVLRQYNDSSLNEQLVAEFLLTRGNWSFMGTDWNGCSASTTFYPRM
jgi:hypothetical protein